MIQNALLAAAYMAVGLSSSHELLEHYKDGGEIELMTQLTAYAPYAVALDVAGLSIAGQYPGVVAYEVYQPFGQWFGEQILVLNGCTPGRAACAAYLQELMVSFYSKVTPAVYHQSLAAALAAERLKPLTGEPR
jgi:hypothetical protein